MLEASISAVGFPIVFYYGWTGIACAIYYRHELRKSARNMLLLGIAPLLGGLAMWGVGVKAALYYNETENGGQASILGFTLPLWMGIGGMILGGIIMIVSRPVFKEYFSRKREVAPPGMLDKPASAILPAPVEF